MAGGGERTMRVGPVSVFVLVVVLCLAVMAVLSVATAQASRAEAQSQARFSSATYENDAAAARTLAEVDASLAESAQAGRSSAQAAAALLDVLPEGAVVEGNEVEASFSSANGRTLTVRLAVRDDLTYELVRWSTGMERQEERTGGMLWAG